jgi:dipeptide/tripeptide permease
MPAKDPIENSESEAIQGSQADKARAGVIGHNVRYVLGFGLAGAILAFAIVSFLIGQGWL